MRFKTTSSIFGDFKEIFDEKWIDENGIKEPLYKWDYDREMHIEDVDIWEIVFESGGGAGVYAAWMPYAEFYMIRTGAWNNNEIETYYGPGSGNIVMKRMKDLGFPFSATKVWVDPEDMWLYQ
jgi:hypothetical protein